MDSVANGKRVSEAGYGVIKDPVGLLSLVICWMVKAEIIDAKQSFGCF